MSHLTDEQVSDWVAGVLEPAAAEALEAHARACPACEARLQREARLERALAAALRAPAPAPSRRTRTLGLVAAPLALAAALAMVLLRPGGPPPLPLVGDAGTSPLAERTHFEGEAPPPEAFQARRPFAL